MEKRKLTQKVAAMRSRQCKWSRCWQWSESEAWNKRQKSWRLCLSIRWDYLRFLLTFFRAIAIWLLRLFRRDFCECDEGLNLAVLAQKYILGSKLHHLSNSNTSSVLHFFGGLLTFEFSAVNKRLGNEHKEPVSLQVLHVKSIIDVLAGESLEITPQSFFQITFFRQDIGFILNENINLA